MIRRLREYYRQFEELSPEEISQQLRERRDAERANALAEVPPLDLTTPAWHEPPDAEAVNAATYALRRSVNRYPDDGALREALAARHGVTPDRVAPGHGAGELLHAAFRAIGTSGGQVAVAWPGWGPLPRLVHEAGGVPVPVPLGEDGAADTEALLDAVGPDTTAVALCTPNDPTGAAVAPADLRALADRLDERVWLLVDAALAEFEPPQGGQTPLGAEPPQGGQTPLGANRAPEPNPAAAAPKGGQTPLAAAAPKGGQTPLGVRERVLVVRSFSKAHAMAGFRAGCALANDEELIDRLSPAGGVSAPAQAAVLWAVRDGDDLVARRRAAAARERERLAAALEGTPFSFPAGHGHLVWLGSSEHEGADVARHLARSRIYVTPGTAWGDDLHVRIALRDAAATDRLAAALREL